MPHPAPLTAKHFVLTATGLLTALLMLLIIISPIDGWWAIFFPREAAVYHLQTTRGGMPFRGCLGYQAEDWQLIRAEGNAALLFDSVATFASTATGRVLGLAGLKDVSSSRFEVLRDSLLAHSNDSVLVYGQLYSSRWVGLREVMDEGLLDSAIADLKGPVPRVEC